MSEKIMQLKRFFRFENVFNDSFFNDESPSRPTQGKNGHFESYSFASTNINGDEKIMKTKNINGKKNIEKIHNGKVKKLRL